MTWALGSDEVQRPIDDGEIEIVEASTDVSGRLLRDAEAHERLASLGLDDDPAGALQLSYDAARKASAALLAVQELRATTRGGHIAVIDAVRAPFNDCGGLPAFGQINRLRRRRNDTECPSLTTPGVTTDEATHALGIAREVIDGAWKLLDTGRLDEFT
jgi:hypothetical protein